MFIMFCCFCLFYFAVLFLFCLFFLFVCLFVCLFGFFLLFFCFLFCFVLFCFFCVLTLIKLKLCLLKTPMRLRKGVFHVQFVCSVVCSFQEKRINSLSIWSFCEVHTDYCVHLGIPMQINNASFRRGHSCTA